MMPTRARVSHTASSELKAGESMLNADNSKISAGGYTKKNKYDGHHLCFSRVVFGAPPNTVSVWVAPLRTITQSAACDS